MKKIEGELFSHYQKDVYTFNSDPFKNGFKGKTEKEWNRFGASVNRIRASEGYKVDSFKELIDEVAVVTINNKAFEMFYRGQSKDYLNNQAIIYSDRKKKSIIYPAICRPEKKSDGTLKYSIRKKAIKERYKKLYDLINFINRKRKTRLPDEYYMSLFQHYEISSTPLIDITQSLRVAATFALQKENCGYLYVFGLPFPNQSISYFTDLGIILLKLQNIVSVEAIRPRYQEGYLVGKFPFSETKTVGDDLSNRMVAKFKLDNTNGKFWDKYFQPMPNEILFPENDKIENQLKSYKLEFEKNNMK
ncbi:FRG domain-containing protein [Salinimicrobium sp. 3283s]|uniref:FRG domain-containing protein n=1 Tax=Salinimicrobium sp. 3283s TaxID=3114359 RepID=UPI0031E6F46B